MSVQDRTPDLERELAESRQAIRDLSDSERLYRALFEGTGTAVTVRSLDNQAFIECNQAALRLYGASSVEQLRRSTVLDLSTPTQPDGSPSTPRLREHVNAAIRNGTERCEWSARRLDGTPFLADIRIEIVELEGGRRVMQTIIYDITESKAAREALERRAQLDVLGGEISRAFLEKDVEGAIRFAAASMAAFLGVEVDAVGAWLVAPSAPGLPAGSESAGLVDRVRETVALARARAEAQEALRAGEERYRSLVERSHDAIVTFDLEGKIRFASPAAENLVGYPAAELIGVPVAEFIVPEEHERMEQNIVAVRDGVDVPAFNWRLRHKDGPHRAGRRRSAPSSTRARTARSWARRRSSATCPSGTASSRCVTPSPSSSIAPGRTPSRPVARRSAFVANA